MASTQDDAFREIQLSGKQARICVHGRSGHRGRDLPVRRAGRPRRVGPARTPRSGRAWRMLPSHRRRPPRPARPLPSAPVTAGEKLSYAERLAAPEPAAEQLKKSDPIRRRRPQVAKADPCPRRNLIRPRKRLRLARAGRRRHLLQPRRLRRRRQPNHREPASRSRSRRCASATKPTSSSSASRARAIRPTWWRPPRARPPMYRVRVGKFKDRSEADTVAARLQKEEQFKPWVVR